MAEKVRKIDDIIAEIQRKCDAMREDMQSAVRRQKQASPKQQMESAICRPSNLYKWVERNHG